MKHRIFRNRLARMPLAALLAALALTISSCLRDNLDDCPSPYNVRLLVTTDYEKEHPGPTRTAAAIGWYEDQIENVSVYVFDEDDRFVAMWSGPRYTLGETYEALFCLEEGKSYQFVAWTNSEGGIFTPSHLGDQLTGYSRADLHIDLALPESRTLTTDMAHRHRGTLDRVPVFTRATPGVSVNVSEHEIVLRPHTYRVNFIVRGLDADMTEFNRYDLKVTDSNASHNFTGALVADRQQEYFHSRTLAETPATRVADEIATSVILLQIGDETETSYQLTNTTQNRPLHGGDLLEALETAYSAQIGPGKTYADLDEMLDNRFEYDLILKSTPLGVEIEIHPWNYKPNPTDL
jgi:hypothetical protein